MAGIRFRIISAVQGLSVPRGQRYTVTGFTATNPGNMEQHRTKDLVRVTAGQPRAYRIKADVCGFGG